MTSRLLTAEQVQAIVKAHYRDPYSGFCVTCGDRQSPCSTKRLADHATALLDALEQAEKRARHYTHPDAWFCGGCGVRDYEPHREGCCFGMITREDRLP